MKTSKSPRVSVNPPGATGRRTRRPRPTPRWLTRRADLDEMAKRRCLLVLSVLRGGSGRSVM